MLAIPLAVLVIAGAASCEALRVLTENPDSPEYAHFADDVVERLKEHMTREMAPLKAAIEEVWTAVDESCGRTVLVDTPALPPPALPNPALVNLSTKLQEMDARLSEVAQKIGSMEETLATSSEVKTLQGALATILEETMRYVENQVDSLVTEAKVEAVVTGQAEAVKAEVEAVVKGQAEAVKAKVEAVVNGQTEAVKEAAKEVQETCSSEVRLTELVQDVRQVSEDVELLKEEAQGTRRNLEECIRQNTTEEVRGVGEKVEEVVEKVERLRSALEVDLEGLAGKVEEIFSATELLAATPPPPPPPPPTTTTEATTTTTTTTDTAPVYPCLDSTFEGVPIPEKMCQTAAHYKKCHLPIVSYHCCHTCTSQSQLPKMGPWRHINLPRTVSLVEVIRFFSP